MREGRFRDEIVPVTVRPPKGDPLVVDTDEHPRPETTAEALAKLKPAFAVNGSVTAGNASGVNDGAAALLVATAAYAESAGLRPLARIVATAVAGVDPAVMGLGPVPAA